MIPFDVKQLLGIAGAPFILAFVQLVKGTFPNLNPLYLPAITVGSAVVFNLGLGLYLHADLVISGLLGVITGFTASGLYSQATILKSDVPNPKLPPRG